MRVIFSYIILLVVFLGDAFAQTDSIPEVKSTYKPINSPLGVRFKTESTFKFDKPSYDLDKIIDNISVNGYYRFYGWQRNLRDPWSVLPENQFANTPPYTLGVGDVYRDPPMLLLVMGVKPSSRTYIGMDYALYSNFTGNLGQASPNLNLGINLNGSFSTDVGKFGFQLGGINWIELSDLVFSSFIGYERFSLFTRNPWEGALSTVDRAEYFFNNGTISRDTRFGMQAFKGVLVDGTNLPGNLSFRALFGTTPVTADLTNNIPNHTYGGQLKWSPKFADISYNTINYVVYTDSLALDRGGVDVHTLSVQKEYKDIMFNVEAGKGRLYSVTQNEKWGNAIRAKIRFPKKMTGLPIELEYFNIDPQFVNYYASFLSSNTAIIGSIQGAQGIATGGGSTSFAGSIADIGQISNNRTGATINTWFDYKKTKVSLGLMVSREKDIQSNVLSWGHKINALPFSRFITFTNNVGPYDRWTSFFRGFSQQTSITDVGSDSLHFSHTTFNTFQAHVKQGFNVFNRKFFAFYVGTFGSAGSKFSLIPQLNDKSYLQAQYHEFDLHGEINDTYSIVGTAGWEFINGNEQTSRGDNVNGVLGDEVNDPVNQRSTLLGIGIDVNISDVSGLYIRRRWFTQKDASFVLDDIKGTDTTIEFKIFF